MPIRGFSNGMAITISAAGARAGRISVAGAAIRFSGQVADSNGQVADNSGQAPDSLVRGNDRARDKDPPEGNDRPPSSSLPVDRAARGRHQVGAAMPLAI